MATRATYEVENMKFYIHHDGYPEGAANYFVKAYETKKSYDHAIPLDFAFSLANKKAEHIKSHDDHGDTEYRYTVKKIPYQLDETDLTTMIRVDKREYNRLTGLMYWATDYYGTLINFVAENATSLNTIDELDEAV